MKKFLKTPGGALSYEGVDINWIRGRPPEMTIKHDGVTVETINLSPYTYNNLHALFVRKGFARRFSYENEAAAPLEEVPNKETRKSLLRGARRHKAGH